jgi:hypothetical protein
MQEFSNNRTKAQFYNRRTGIKEGRGVKASRCVLLLLVSAASLLTAARAQSAKSEPDRDASVPAVSDCQAVRGTDARLDLVAKLCEFALGYKDQLPNFVVQQTMSFETVASKTVMTAEVTFQKGLETYSRVTVNGRPAPVSTITAKPSDAIQFSSTGEFGPALLDLFRVPGATQFKFKTNSTLQDRPVAVYEFHIPQKENRFWTVRPGDGRTIRPEFNGELWLEQQTGKPLREEIQPVKLLLGAELVSTKTVIEYANTPVAAAGTFLLPSKSESTMCKHGVNQEPNCTKTVLVFHDYRKFGAETRILPSQQ